MLDHAKRILAELIAFPTVSADSNLNLIHHVRDYLLNHGARVDIFHDETGCKANLFATIGPVCDGGIVLSGHSDVVPVVDQNWTTDPFQMVERDGKLFGRGSCDMKGFIAAVLAMVPTWSRQVTNRPIHIALTYDEETGCIGAGHLVQSLQSMNVHPAVAIIGEPTNMQIIEGHKGCYEYSAHFQGVEGHGSAPDQGVNAIEYAALYVAKLLDLREQLKTRVPDGSPFSPPWTTINIGALNGGQVHNVIPAKAQVDWEMRPVQTSDADFVKERLKEYCDQTLIPAMQAVHPNTGITTDIIGEVGPLIPSDSNEAFEIVAALTGHNQADVVSFGTEGGFFQDLGMDVVVCGPGSIEQAHKADEYLTVEQLEQCLQMLERLVTVACTSQ